MESKASVDPLRLQVTRGIAWSAAHEWGAQATNLMVFIILARLLDAQIFGLVALSAVFMSFVKSFVDQGLSTAIIQRRDLDSDHLNSVFWLSLTVGLVFTLVGISAANPIARLFGESELAGVIRGMAPVFVLDALGTVHQALLRRRFQFKVLAVRGLLSIAVGGGVGILLALNGWGVTSIVLQQLVTAGVGLVLLWAVEDWRPIFTFSTAHARQLIGFGYNILGIRLVTFATRRADDILIGLVLGTVALGYYTVAYKIYKVLLDVVAVVVARVALPALASLQSEKERFRSAINTSVMLVSYVALPVFIGLALVSVDIVPILFGVEWSPSAPVIRVLAVAGLSQAVLIIFQQAFIGFGKPEWAFRVLLAMSVVMIGAFAVLAPHGIVAVAAGFAGVGFVFVPVQLYMLNRAVGLTALGLVTACKVPLLATACMATAVLVWQRISTVLRPEVSVLGALLVGALSYASVVVAVEPNAFTRMRSALSRRPRAAASGSS